MNGDVVCQSCVAVIQVGKHYYGSYLKTWHCVDCASTIDIHEWAEIKMEEDYGTV